MPKVTPSEPCCTPLCLSRASAAETGENTLKSLTFPASLELAMSWDHIWQWDAGVLWRYDVQGFLYWRGDPLLPSALCAPTAQDPNPPWSSPSCPRAADHLALPAPRWGWGVGGGRGLLPCLGTRYPLKQAGWVCAMWQACS